MTSSALLDAARRLVPKIREARDFGEEHRHLEPGVLAAMHEAKFFRMMIPADTSGLQTDLPTAMKVVETIASADGATGWNLMIGAAYGVWASRLGAEAAREIYSADDAVVAGALRPSGKARRVDGGFVCEGQWSFASGIGHSSWWAAGCVVHDGEAPCKNADGKPETRLVFFPATDGELIDTWTVGGMRGTGSHDYAIKDLFVPIERTLPADAPSRLQDTLYNLPLMALMDSMMAAVPLGIARAAIDAFIEIAGGRFGHGSTTAAANKPTVQADVGRAEAVLRAARAWLYETVEEAWTDVQAGRNVSTRQAALMRLARVNALTAGVQATDLIYTAAGSASVYSTGLVDRCFRDVHVAAQHVAIHPANYEVCGAVLLGLPPPRSL
jgi:alkylation response protein AidB-like acyl-CoA dehydrogenase